MAEVTTPATGRVNSKIYYPIFGTGSISPQVSSSSVNDNVKPYTPTIIPQTTTNSPSTSNQGVGSNYYGLNQASVGPYTGVGAGFTVGPGGASIGPSASNYGGGQQTVGAPSGTGRYYYNGQYLDVLPGPPGSWNIGTPRDPNDPFSLGPGPGLPLDAIPVTPKDPNFDYTKATHWLDFSNSIHDMNYFALQYLKNNDIYGTGIQQDPISTLPRDALFQLMREAAVSIGIIPDFLVSHSSDTLGSNLGAGIYQGSIILNRAKEFGGDVDISEKVAALAREKGWLDASGKSTLPPDTYQILAQQELDTKRTNASAQIERILKGEQALLPGQTIEQILADAAKYGIPVNYPVTASGNNPDAASKNSPSGSTVGNADQNNTAFNNNNSDPIKTSGDAAYNSTNNSGGDSRFDSNGGYIGGGSGSGEFGGGGGGGGD